MVPRELVFHNQSDAAGSAHGVTAGVTPDVEIIHLDSRRSVLDSGHFGTVQSDVLQWQEWQIVQSQFDLRDLLL